MEYKVEMPYIGGILSKNLSRFPNKKGFRPFVKFWMKELGEKVSSLNIPKAGAYSISLFGKFSDERRPDLANLHEVIGDSLKVALGVDDKFFLFVDKGWELGHLDPTLIIFIEPREGN